MCCAPNPRHPPHTGCQRGNVHAQALHCFTQRNAKRARGYTATTDASVVVSQTQLGTMFQWKNLVVLRGNMWESCSAPQNCSTRIAPLPPLPPLKHSIRTQLKKKKAESGGSATYHVKVVGVCGAVKRARLVHDVQPARRLGNGVAHDAGSLHPFACSTSFRITPSVSTPFATFYGIRMEEHT